ncbi:MAG TPA: flagellar filament capping protein FliD [Novosphingobium sp.]|nr:flagellar filament capping protein FliD [Novosphingobium sp.]
MATTSATSSIITTLGAGSGIDMAGLAQSLASASFAAKIDRNTARSETIDRQISAASALKSAILQLSSSIGDRVRTGDLSSQPQIANAGVATVSRGTVSGRGTYSLEVSQLATNQVLASAPFTEAATPIGSGSLTFRFGTIAAGAFTEDTEQSPAAVTIPSGATLADVAAAVNTAGIGVTAYVATGTDGAHLMFKGKEGAANGFVIEASETVGEEGLAALAWSPASAPALLKTTARDAQFQLDGLAMSSPSNSITDLVPGLSLSLTGTNIGAPTAIRFADPGAAVSTFMSDLVAALNELAGELKTQTDPSSGDLARDSGARAMRQALGQLAGTIVMPGAANGEPRTLADLGLATNRDGTFRLDSDRLSATLKSAPEGVAAMFTTGLHGVYGTFDKLSRRLTAASDPGTLAGSLTRFTRQKQDLSEEATKLAEAQERLRARLATQFAAVDSRVAASKSTLSFLQNQIDAWNAKSN